jgi:hypothetical protein
MPLTERQREAVDVLKAHNGNVTHAAEAMGMARTSFQRLLSRAKTNADPAIEAAMEAAKTGLIPGAVWIKTGKDAEGVSRSVYLRPPVDEGPDVMERIREAFEGIEPAAPVSSPEVTDADLLTIYPIADAHIGMMAWGKETGEDYDTAKGARRVREWVARAVAASPPSETAIILDVGDYTHADSNDNQTPQSKHPLSVDTRHFRTLDMGIAALGSAIESARAKHRRVIVRVLPGNHNVTSYMAVMFALAERYRNEPAVEVQKVPGEFFIHEFGRVMIAAHHGDKAKPDRIVHFVADEAAEAWGRTKHRFLFLGHLHHHRSQDIGGMKCETLRAITARDAYAVSHAYSARAQLSGITYHREHGEVQRVNVSS